MNAPKIAFLASLLVAGCATIHSARETQRDLAPRYGEDEGSCERLSRVDFRAFSLADLVDFAMTNRPSVLSKTLAVKDAHLALKELVADAPLVGGGQAIWTVPKLSVSGSYSAASDGVHAGDSLSTRKGQVGGELSLDLLVYDFGRFQAEAQAQVEKIIAAEHALSQERWSVFQEVSESYFDFYEKRALLAVSITNAFQYAEHLTRAEERRKAGEANRLDVLKARLDLAQARQSVVSASNLVETTGAELMQALGVEAARGTWGDAFGTESVGVHSVRQAFGATTEDVGEAFAFARTNAPTLRLARANFRAASYKVDAAIADLYPSLSLSASLSWSDPLWVFRWGASCVQSIFQGFRKTTAVDRAVVALQSASADVDAAEQTLSVELEKAIANRDNSREALASAWSSMLQAAENLETVREQFAVGSASRVELSEAIASDSQARGDAIEAFYAGQRAEAALLALTGREVVFQERTRDEKERMK